MGRPARDALSASSPGAQNGSQKAVGAFFGLGGQYVATPAAPKCCQCRAELNKQVGAPTLAPAWQDPIGDVRNPHQLQPDDEGLLASDGS
jgi:hypothetical protein